MVAVVQADVPSVEQAAVNAPLAAQPAATTGPDHAQGQAVLSVVRGLVAARAAASTRAAAQAVCDSSFAGSSSGDGQRRWDASEASCHQQLLRPATKFPTADAKPLAALSRHLTMLLAAGSFAMPWTLGGLAEAWQLLRCFGLCQHLACNSSSVALAVAASKSCEAHPAQVPHSLAPGAMACHGVQSLVASLGKQHRQSDLKPGLKP